MKTFALTTKDNPFNPFTEFGSWYRYDMDKGYSTCCLLARIARYSTEMCEPEEVRETERAINEIIKYDPLDIYRKVEHDEPSDWDSVISKNEETLN